MKKKILLGCSLILTFTLSLCACGNTSTKTQDVIGTYKNVTFSSSSKFTLNEDSTYDRTLPNEKGTYKTSPKGGFTLTNTDDDDTIFAQKDGFYYRTNLICCFEEDEEYGKAPTFNESGKSNQAFCAYYDSISDSKWNVIILEMKEDGTFILRDCTRDASGNQSDGTIYEGTYVLNDYLLSLTCGDGQTIPFLLIDDKIYFDVFEKQ